MIDLNQSYASSPQGFNINLDYCLHTDKIHNVTSMKSLTAKGLDKKQTLITMKKAINSSKFKIMLGEKKKEIVNNKDNKNSSFS